MSYRPLSLVTVLVLMIAVSLVFVRNCTYSYSERLSSHREILADTIDDEYDYIIVGGGTAGSVVAARLAEDKSNRVLLLEAGGFYDQYPSVHSIREWFSLQKTEVDWAYVTIPQSYSSLGMNERRIYWPRGRVLGGTGMINAMQYTRGNRFDFDEWESMGCSGWGYNDVLSYFLKSEDMRVNRLKSSKYHSIGGPVSIGENAHTPLYDIFLNAASELGYSESDYNGEKQEGFSPCYLLARDGFRESTSLAYLGRRGKQNNLDIVVNSFVTKINFEDKLADGVYLIRNGRKYFVRATKEIILTAGAINTPQLLMLSGIGPRDHLTDMNISVVADLPVGNNLQDHQFVSMYSNINQSMPKEQLTGIWPRFQRALFTSGPLVSTGSVGNIFLSLNKSAGSGKTDIQFILSSSVHTPENTKNYIVDEIKRGIGQDRFTVVLANTRPKSKGTLRLKSTDSFEHPLLDPCYLKEVDDVEDFIGGIRIWEKFVQTPTMKSLGVDLNQMKMSFCSKHEFRSDSYWECFLRHLAATLYHPCCTSRMGAYGDPSAVLDPELRVRGITGLRVADASAFPTITSGNINAPVVMLAEKAADMIRGIK